MKKNYKLQITIKEIKDSHGLHKGPIKLQTVTALIKSFCGGGRAKRKAQGAKRIIQLTLCAFPLAAGGK